MSLEHILLGMLRDPATGYDLGKEFNQGAKHFWYAERSQIYPTLARLEERGWLHCWNEPSERGPERKVYETTEDGLRALREWLLDGPHIGRDRLAYIAQAYFLDALGDLEGSVRVIESMRVQWSQALAVLESTENQILAGCGPPEEHDEELLHQYAALRMGIFQYRAKLAWCEETLTALRTRVETEVPDDTNDDSVAETVAEITE